MTHECESKLISLEALVNRRRAWAEADRTVVWTNGCFDLFHAGHAFSLQAARALGHVLVVGLNSDASVRRLKGPDRPVVPERERAELLSALTCVDQVLLFDGPDCATELTELQPDIYAQGEDYTLETIHPGERAAVEAGGGRIDFLPLREGISASMIIKRIRRSDPEKIVSAAFGLLRDESGRLLLVATRYLEGVRWGLPGGGHERGEPLETTAVREIREETGFDVAVRRYRGIIERIEPRWNLHLVLHLFEVERTGGTLRTDTRSEDIVEARFVDAPTLRELPGWVLGREHLVRYIENPDALPPYIYMGPGEE